MRMYISLTTTMLVKKKASYIRRESQLLKPESICLTEYPMCRWGSLEWLDGLFVAGSRSHKRHWEYVWADLGTWYIFYPYTLFGFGNFESCKTFAFIWIVLSLGASRVCFNMPQNHNCQRQRYWVLSHCFLPRIPQYQQNVSLGSHHSSEEAQDNVWDNVTHKTYQVIQR